MTGDDRVRACGTCKQQVYNLSNMTHAEAESLLRERDHLCVRYFRRNDGTILTRDCSVGIPRAQRRRLAVVGAAAALASTLLIQRGVERDGAASITAGSQEPCEIELASTIAHESPPPSVIEHPDDPARPQIIQHDPTLDRERGVWMLGNK